MACRVKVDENLKELEQASDPDFPVRGYDESFNEFAGHEVAWHWHDEIEVIKVYQGSTLVECCDQKFLLHSGDGILINVNVLHHLTLQSPEDCKIINLEFRPAFVGGTENSVIYRRYVLPVITCENFLASPLIQTVGWQQQTLNDIRQAYTVYQQAVPGYEIQVQTLLMDMWRMFFCNSNFSSTDKHVNSLQQTRLKQMLSFISENYQDKITISQLASIASISESECYRCFQKNLSLSPMNYLLNLRMQKAAELILRGALSITQICSEVGIQNPSYFTRQFRKIYHCTPSEFKKK